MPLTNNIKYIFKKMNCGCIITANIHRGFSYALIQSVTNIDSCGFCTEEQKEETERHLWLTETEKYVWEDLLKCYGWKSDSDRRSDIIPELQDITKHNEKMETEHPLWNRHCGERIDRNFDSRDID